MNLKPLNLVRKKVEAIRLAVYNDLEAAISSNKATLVLIQTQLQLFNKGEDLKGVSLRPSYSIATISEKTKKGQPTDRVTLKDTGDFYNSISIEVKGRQMIVTANVPYTEYLTERYGIGIFGIQDEELRRFLVKFYVPAFKESVNKISNQ